MRRKFSGWLTALAVWFFLLPSAPGQTAPAPLTIESVARDQRLWPKEIITKAPATTVAKAGPQAGKTVTLPAGEMARVLKVEKGSVRVQYQGQEFTLPASDTDVLAGATTRRMQLENAAKAAAGTSNPTPDEDGNLPAARKDREDRAAILKTLFRKQGGWFLGLGLAVLIVLVAARRASQ